MNAWQMRVELVNILTTYSNRTGTPFWTIWNVVRRIAAHRGIIGKPLEMAGRVMIATDIINAWENPYTNPAEL